MKAQKTDRETELDTIVGRINEEVNQHLEYVEEHRDSHYADFVETYGYSEADAYDIWREFEYNATIDADQLKEIEDAIPDVCDRVKQMQAFTSAEPGSMYTSDNQCFSIQIGEQELQPSDELEAMLDSLSVDEMEYVKRRADAYINDSLWLYVSSDVWWQAIVDAEGFYKGITGK